MCTYFVYECEVIKLNKISTTENLRLLYAFILDAVLTVSPNRQYLGIIDPTIPAIQGPVKEIHLIKDELSNHFLCV